MDDRMKVLRVFYPGAKPDDWRLIDGGIRVQAIKKTDAEAGIVHYGTEVITNVERNISALLGTSPGASVSVSIALELIRNCLPDLINGPMKQARLQAMVPSILIDTTQTAYAARLSDIGAQTDAVLQLH